MPSHHRHPALVPRDHRKPQHFRYQQEAWRQWKKTYSPQQVRSRAFLDAQAAGGPLNLTSVRPSAPEVMDLLSPLPDEILLQVWMHVSNPVPLSRTSKRFQALSKSTLWRAKWFLKQYQRYQVIYEAIARPKLCTSVLVEQLLRLGAPLSRSLVQLLHALREPQLRQKLLVEHQSRSLRTDWGRHVSHSSYATLIHHSSKLVSHYADGC